MVRGQRIQLKIWDNVFLDYSRQIDLLADSTKPFGIVVTSTMVKYFNGKISLNTSTSTKIYIDLQISEVDELKSLWSEKLDNATIGKLEIQHINIGLEEINSKKVDILTLTNHDLIFYCMAKVDTIMSENSWYYILCPTCKRRITPRKTDFWCIPCEKQIERPTPRYRLELSVIDHSGSTIFVVFDEEAKKLIGQDASTLFEAHTYEKNKDVIKDNEDTSKDEATVIEETAKRPFNNIDSTEKDHDSSNQITSKKIKV
ncbi:replication protein A 70 kDa DNA-binding subunit D-like [Chenopodium quinoa]|uniref:replication protein A 70 kDa DNA-binding subunit D-like n=1 Tax=Chenopodium quinoa TaxID=63459 RepID=UPI000B7946CB|nr:replication protein A 70 kDa DNA-binding subunit D-like [Chenopodium quinoa]